jgi:hypothetical protein
MRLLMLMIAWALIGSALSIALAGCAHRAERPAPAPIAVHVDDTPPPDLLACPVAPAGFPIDAEATMPAPVRAAAIRLAAAYAAVAVQLQRLVNWHAPGSCPR